MHQTTNGKMRHHQTIELLPDRVRSLTAQHYVGAAQMGFEFIQRSLYFPALVIQSGQFFGWCYFVIKNCREQAIDGLCTLNTLQAIFNNSNENAIFL